MNECRNKRSVAGSAVGDLPVTQAARDRIPDEALHFIIIAVKKKKRTR